VVTKRELLTEVWRVPYAAGGCQAHLRRRWTLAEFVIRTTDGHVDHATNDTAGGTINSPIAASPTRGVRAAGPSALDPVVTLGRASH
jgi:hypothetical protein